MDYEKKYRDLVEAVKALQEANPSDEGIQKWVEDNVPELKESEDERVRKNIINWLKNIEGQTIPINEYNSALAWLEKQGEQKSVEVRTTGYWNVQDIEQKPDDKVESSAQNKPIHSVGEAQEWLQSLNTRVQPQRIVSAEAKEAMYDKPAWSEEDEARFESCIKVLQTSDGYDTINTKWLKSLKDRVQPQSQWKPSDEQMNTLEYYMHTLICNKHKEILFGLYSDLKKLKE